MGPCQVGRVDCVDRTENVKDANGMFNEKDEYDEYEKGRGAGLLRCRCFYQQKQRTFP